MSVSTAQNTMLMDYLAENAIEVESNLTSDLQTRVPNSYQHPLQTF